jgi:hypothetical protein
MNPVSRVVAVNTDVCSFAEVFRQYNVISLEQSVKIHNSSVNNGRILVKFQIQDMPMDHLLEILGSLSFPVEYMYWLYNQYNNSDYVIIGLDTDARVYRLYFEKLISKRAEPEQPHECMNSVKWRFDSEGIQRTRYYWILTNNPDTVYDTAKACGIQQLPEFVTNYIENNEDYRNFKFANDLGTDRMSICIPFKPDTVYLKDTNYTNICEFNGYPIKWYQGGIDKDNNEFYTLYFSIYRDIPRPRKIAT